MAVHVVIEDCILQALFLVHVIKSIIDTVQIRVLKLTEYVSNLSVLLLSCITAGYGKVPTSVSLRKEPVKLEELTVISK